MSADKRYDTWFKRALEYPYKAVRISELLDTDTNDPRGYVLIEGFVLEKEVANNNDGTVYFVIGNEKSDADGKRVLAKAGGSCHSAFSEIDDSVGIAGKYDPQSMEISVYRFFNKSLAKRLLNEKEYDVHEIKLKGDDDGN